jgi:pimeloyl-ACP methyl ester carboxylesterase
LEAGERKVSRLVYLHGFASGPTSKKAQFFRSRFAQLGMGLEIPDLADGNFERLTISGQLEVIERALRGEPALLIGSSMGGYLAALFAARHPEVQKLVLMAPAFCFATRWPLTLGEAAMQEWERRGALQVFHYGQARTVELGYQLIEDGRQYEDYPLVRQPVLLFHGKNDTVVPADLSVQFAGLHPQAQLHLMNSDHELLNVLDQMWMETEKFLFGNQAAGGSSTRS